MEDTRITNAYHDIRADIHGLSKTARELDELLGQLHGDEQTHIRRAANSIAAAIAAMANAVEELHAAAGTCRHPSGFTYCTQIKGHGGDHSNGTITWDEDQAERTDAAIVASMGGRTE